MWQQTTQHCFQRNKPAVSFYKKYDYLIHHEGGSCTHSQIEKGKQGKKCWKDWWCSPGEESKQHVWRVKKPFTVNQAPRTSQAGRETLSNMNLSAEWTQGMSHQASILFMFWYPMQRLPSNQVESVYVSRVRQTGELWSCWVIKKNVILITTGNNYPRINVGNQVIWRLVPFPVHCMRVSDVCNCQICFRGSSGYLILFVCVLVNMNEKESQKVEVGTKRDLDIKNKTLWKRQLISKWTFCHPLIPLSSFFIYMALLLCVKIAVNYLFMTDSLNGLFTTVKGIVELIMT